jgi:hypothetical protein
MDESLTQEKAAARRWTWRIPGYVLLPFYLMLIGIGLRYALYVLNSVHWGFNDYLSELCV